MIASGSTTPEISVLLSVKDGGGELEGTLQSLAWQTFSNFEVLVMDDGSSDGTPKVLATWAARDARFRVLHHESPKGLTVSLNELLREARGTFVARLDCGDFSARRRFELQRKSLLDAPEAIGSLCPFWQLDEEGRALNIMHVPGNPAGWREALGSSNPAAHSTFFFRREVMQQLGYDESFRCAQDYEMLIRAAASGDIVTVPEPLVAIRLNPRGITFRNLPLQDAYATRVKLSPEERLNLPVPTLQPVTQRTAEGSYHFYVGKIHLSRLRMDLAQRHLKLALDAEPTSQERRKWYRRALLPRFILKFKAKRHLLEDIPPEIPGATHEGA